MRTGETFASTIGGRQGGPAKGATLALATALIVLLALRMPAGTPVLAIGSDGPGTATDPSQDPLAMPRDLSQESGSCVVRLTWEAPASPPEDVLAYDIYRWVDAALGDPKWLGSTKPTTKEFLDYEVTNGRTYIYTVRARYDDKVRSNTPGTVTAVPEVSGLSIVLDLNETRALVNGARIPLEVPAQVLGGRTMVPLRFIASGLGADVRYDSGPKQITATLGDRVVKLWVDRKEAEVDGHSRELGSPPVIVNGRTMVPIRFISEVFGALVDYLPSQGRVTVDMPDTDAAPEEATLLTVGQTYTAALNGSNDVDMYMFRTSPGDTYVVRTHNLAPGCDTVVAVLTPRLDVDWYNDDCSYDSLASEVQVYKYGDSAFLYVRVQSGRPGGANPAGNYSITVEKRPDNPRDLITRLLEGAPATQGRLRSPADRDYYVFRARAGGYYAIRTTNLSEPGPDGQPAESDTSIWLLDPEFNVVCLDDDSSTHQPGAAEIFFRCRTSGDHYIIVDSSSGRPGPYTIEVDGAEPESWESPEQAVVTRPDHDCWREWLSSPDDEDWFSFTATKGTGYFIQTMDLAPGCDTVIRVYGPEGAELARDDDALGCGYGSRLEWIAPESGEFYVRVTGWPYSGSYGSMGAYCFCVTTTGPEYDSYDTDMAVALEPDGPVVSGSLVNGDIDWFVFEAAKGLTYTVETGDLDGGCDTHLLLMDEDGYILADSDDTDKESPPSRVEWTATYGGPVLIAVKTSPDPGEDADGTGTYTIRVTTSAEGTGL